jgi:hypothetical protein
MLGQGRGLYHASSCSTTLMQSTALEVDIASCHTSLELPSCCCYRCCCCCFCHISGHIARGHASGAFQHLASGAAAHYRPNAARQQQQQQGGGSSTTAGKQALQPNQNNMQKLSSRICVRDDPLDSLDGHRLSAGVANTLKVSSAKAAAARVRAGDKSDRATVEQALDPRTRMVSCCCCCFSRHVGELVLLLPAKAWRMLWCCWRGILVQVVAAAAATAAVMSCGRQAGWQYQLARNATLAGNNSIWSSKGGRARSVKLCLASSSRCNWQCLLAGMLSRCSVVRDA